MQNRLRHSGFGGIPAIGNISSTWTPRIPLGGESVNFWVKGRSGLSMSDNIGVNDIDITTPTYRGVTGGWLTGSVGALERFFDGDSHTLYFKTKLISATVGTQEVFRCGNYFDTARGLSIVISGDAWYFVAGDGTNSAEIWQILDIDVTLLPADWIEVFVEVDMITNRLRCNMYKLSDGAAIPLGQVVNVDISGWTFNTNNNAAAMRIVTTTFAHADLKKFTGLKTLAQCRNNAYVTDLQFYYPTIWDRTDVSGNAHHLAVVSISPKYTNKYFSNVSTYCFDYGYSLYRSVGKETHTPAQGYIDIYVPHTPVGVAVAMTILDENADAYVKIEEHAGNLTRHNLADSLIDIPVAQWDKSNATIFEDAVRSSIFYDAGNPNNWHISELDYLLFTGNCKTDNKGLNFFKISDNSLATNDRKYLDELFSYNTNKTGNYLDRILKYTEDFDALADCIQLFADGSINQTIYLNLAGITGTSSIQVYWGDGTKAELQTMNNLGVQLDHVYANALLYPIYICNPENILKIILTCEPTQEISPLDKNVAEFAKAINMTSFELAGTTVWSGSMDGFNKELEDFRVHHNTNITGTITPFRSLKNLDVSCPMDGDLSGIISLVTTFWGANTGLTIRVDITGMINLTHSDSYAPNGWGGGDVSTCTKLVQLCWGACPNEFYGSIEALADFNYLDNYGNSTMTGDISGMVKLWKFISRSCHNAFTGSIDNLILLEYFQITANDETIISRPSTIANKPLLVFLYNDQWSFTETEVNQILADKWADRNAAMLWPDVRELVLNTGTSAAPTGQGILDTANLQNYHSPTPPGTAVVWQILTNLSLDVEKIVNGDFAEDDHWTKTEATITIVSGKLDFNATTNGNIAYQAAGLTITSQYLVTFEVSSYSAGGVYVLCGGGGGGTSKTANGIYNELLTCAGDTIFYIAAVGLTTLKVDNVSVRKVL